jgi:hypothetical protein
VIKRVLNPHQFGPLLEPREGRPPTIEAAMDRRAWKNLNDGPDADDSGGD